MSSQSVPGRIQHRRRSSRLLQQQQQHQQANLSSLSEVNQSEQQKEKMSQFKRGMYVKNLEKANKKAKEDEFKDMSIIEIEDLLKLLETDFNAFRHEQGELLDKAADLDEANSHNEFYDKHEEVYLETRKIFRKRIEELKQKQASPKASNNQKPMQLELKNAEIPNTWGTFDGHYAAWPSFRDRFKTVHDDAGLPVARKFDFLTKALVGQAKIDTRNLSVNDATYADVWQRLVNRYEDDYRVVHELVQKVLSMRKLSAPSCVGLRRILDTMRDCLSQLETYCDIKSWDPLLVFHVIDLLDTETQREWERIREKKSKNEAHTNEIQAADAEGLDAETVPMKRYAEIPSWRTLEAFLEQQAKFLALNDDQRGAQGGVSIGSGRTRAYSGGQADQQVARKAPKAEKSPCALCSGNHPIWKCNDWFTKVNLAGKRQVIHDKNLCHVCLKPNHNDLMCYRDKDGHKVKAQPCPRCPGMLYHNSTICPTSEAERQEKALASTYSAQSNESGQSKSSVQNRLSSIAASKKRD